MVRKVLVIVALITKMVAAAGCGGHWGVYVNGQKVYPRDEPGTPMKTGVLGPDEVWHQPEFQWTGLPQPATPSGW